MFLILFLMSVILLISSPLFLSESLLIKIFRFFQRDQRPIARIYIDILSFLLLSFSFFTHLFSRLHVFFADTTEIRGYLITWIYVGIPSYLLSTFLVFIRLLLQLYTLLVNITRTKGLPLFYSLVAAFVIIVRPSQFLVIYLLS